MPKSKCKIAIVGAGASGLTCAIQCTRILKSNNINYEVTVFEKLQRVGKKILATGNGRCNLSNEDLNIDYYHGNRDFAKTALDNFGTQDTIDFFNSLGVLTKTEDSRIYPISNSANCILDCLRFECENLGIKFYCESPVNSIKKHNNKFIINHDIVADKIIIATGGKSASVHGSDGSGYRLLQNFGHKLITPLPSLVQINCSNSFCKQLKGVRSSSSITLINNGQVIKKESGEIQFTDYGLSGIACMQVSRFVSKILNDNKNCNLVAKIDLIEKLKKEEIINYINRKIKSNPHLKCENILVGILPKKLSTVILKICNIKSLQMEISKLEQKQIERISANIKSFKLDITGTKDFKSSQVTAGGISSKEFNPITFESTIQKGLYACGEVLDIDGDCGGYNLQWAWCSGFLAGENCAKEIIND